MNKIKLTILYNLPASYSAPLFRELSKEQDLDVTVLFCWKNNSEEGYYDKALGQKIIWDVPLVEGYKYYYLNNLLNWDSTNVFGMCNPEIKDYIENNDIDVLLIGTSYWSPTTWMAIKAAKKKNIPMITRATVELNKKRNWLLRILKKGVVGAYCKKMSAGVYECVEQKEYLMQYGIDEKDLFSAPCAVDNSFFEEQYLRFDCEEVRKKLTINNDSIVFAYVGSFTKRKAVLDILKANKELLNVEKNVEIILIGDGELREELVSYIDENMMKNVLMPGFVNQSKLGEYLKAADVFVLPSLNDASPKVLNEAMNFCLPIIISRNVGTINELLDEGVNGYSFEAGNVDELVKCMSKIVDRKQELKTMGQRSKQLVDACGYNASVIGWKKAIYHVITEEGLKDD